MNKLKAVDVSVQRQRLEQALTLPLDRLVVVSDQVVAAPGAVDEWTLPADDRAALTRWGLPVIEGCMYGDVQPGSAPTVTAGIKQLYGLGLLLNLEVGADPETGFVRGVSELAGTPDSFVNSSVTKFVEVAWRWYWAFHEIKQLRYDIEQYDLLRDFLAFVVKLDEAVEKADESFWQGYVESW